MIKLFITRKEGEEILIGKVEETSLNIVRLSDVVKINLLPTERGTAPFPSYYPNMFIGSLIKQDKLNKMIIDINSSEYIEFEEDNINPDLLDLYRKELGRRSGIELVTSMPTNVRNIR